MLNSPYSPNKIFHHWDRIANLRLGKPALTHIQLIPTNRCNHRCRFCSYRTKGYSSSEEFSTQDQIPYPKIVEIIEDCTRLGVKAIEITGGGEPTVHPNFPEICQTIEKNGIDYAVVTNGSYASDRDLLAMSRAKWVRFSLDSATEETYSEVRRVKRGTLARTRSNLRKLVAIRDQGKEPLAGVGFVVTKDNWKETYSAAVNAREDGADNIRISAVFQNEGAGYFTSFYDETKALIEKAKRDLSEDGFIVFDLFGERLSDLTIGFPKNPKCWLQELVTYIGADLNVYRCCVVAYNPTGLLGSILEKSFYDFWNSPATQETIQKFDARRCPRCMFNTKNERIAYAVSKDPKHVNFL